MKKEKYESPETLATKVKLEQGFMKGSVVDKEDNTDSPVNAGNQEIEGDYDFTGNEWQ